MMGLSLRHRQDLTMTLHQCLKCSVCRSTLLDEPTNATLFLEDKAYRISIEKWLRFMRVWQAGHAHDPLLLCPACEQDAPYPTDRNYRRRAWKFIKTHDISMK